MQRVKQLPPITPTPAACADRGYRIKKPPELVLVEKVVNVEAENPPEPLPRQSLQIGRALACAPRTSRGTMRHPRHRKLIDDDFYLHG